MVRLDGGGGGTDDREDEEEPTVRTQTEVSTMPAAEPGEEPPERTETQVVSTGEASLSEFREATSGDGAVTGDTGGQQPGESGPTADDTDPGPHLPAGDADAAEQRSMGDVMRDARDSLLGDDPMLFGNGRIDAREAVRRARGRARAAKTQMAEAATRDPDEWDIRRIFDRELDPDDLVLGPGNGSGGSAQGQPLVGGGRAPPRGPDAPEVDVTKADFLSDKNFETIADFEEVFFEATTTDEGEKETLDLLTGSGGFLTEEQERQLAGSASQLQERFDFEEEIETTLSEIPGAEQPGAKFVVDVAGGVGRLPGAVASAGPGALVLGETLVETAENIETTIEERGAGPTAGAIGGGLGEVFRSIEAEFQEDPGSFVGEIGAEIVLGTAATRGAIRGAQKGRGAVRKRRADATVDFEDITSERGAAGDLPLFETDPGAPTIEAVSEVRRRARDAPDAVSEAVGTEGTLFHSTEIDLPADLDVGRGGSELPGLFTSPDASPLRLAEGAGETSGLGLRLPRPSDFRSRGDRLEAFPGERIEGMAESATGAGRVFDPDAGEFVPDLSTSGAQFLEESAERGTAFVRPTGSRTRELEAIFPPGSQFTKTGELAVDMPSGRTVSMNIRHRVDADVDAMNDIKDLDLGVSTAEDIADATSRRRGRGPPPGDPVSPPFSVSGPSTTAASDAKAMVDTIASDLDSTAGSESVSDDINSMFDDDVFSDRPERTTGGTTTGPGPTTGPAGTSGGPGGSGPPSSDVPTSPPGDPTSGPPTTGPPTTPTSPPTGPPTTPTSPPTGPPGPPTGPPPGGPTSDLPDVEPLEPIEVEFGRPSKTALFEFDIESVAEFEREFEQIEFAGVRGGRRQRRGGGLFDFESPSLGVEAPAVGGGRSTGRRRKRTGGIEAPALDIEAPVIDGGKKRKRSGGGLDFGPVEAPFVGGNGGRSGGGLDPDFSGVDFKTTDLEVDLGDL